MRTIFTFRRIALFSILAVAVSLAVLAQEAEKAARQLTVMTSGGFSAAYALLAPQFEAATGVSLVTIRGPSSGGSPASIPSRLLRGESADVIILSRGSLDQLTEQGEVRSSTRVDLVRSTIGMAVRSGAAIPNIEARESFIDTIIQSESFGYSESASGNYLSTELFPGLGIWAQIEPKGVRVVGEPVAAVVARGEVEIGFQQISEILAVDGVEFVGPIPAELQRVTTFSAAVTARAKNPIDARLLIEFLSSAAAADIISETGLLPVVWE